MPGAGGGGEWCCNEAGRGVDDGLMHMGCDASLAPLVGAPSVGAAVRVSTEPSKGADDDAKAVVIGGTGG